MKYYFLAAMIMLSACGFAQQPVLTNDLNTGIDKIVKKQIPFNQDDMQWSNYMLDPVQFNERIGQVRKDAYRLIKPRGAKETRLKHLAVDYYLRNILSGYSSMYGFDSVAFSKMEELVQRMAGGAVQDPMVLVSAAKKVKVKTMTAAQTKYMDSLIFSHAYLNNENLFRRSAAYREWLNAFLEKMYQTKDTADITFKNMKGCMPISVVLKEIQNPLIRDYECYQKASADLKLTKDSTMAGKICHDFNASVTNTYYRGEMQQLYDNYKFTHTAGAPAPDFTYADVDGKTVTLSSLHGKYVYIDVWATWCAPCKGEIPFLMKLEEEYRSKNIQFVSLSVDYQVQAGKWRNYVTENKLTGYQVMADKELQSDFIRKFNIASIPRFILIDPAGKVVDADAKRPSDPALKSQFDELLK